MAKLMNFKDNAYGCWATIRLDNGDPCWIGVAQTGILVKKSQIGLFGAKLYEEKNVYKAAETAQALSELYPNDITPREITNPVLKSLTNAVLRCSNSTEVSIVLNEACQMMQTPNTQKQNLLSFANQKRRALGLEETDNIETAVYSILVIILKHAQIYSGRVRLKEPVEEPEAILGMVFLCFIFIQIKQTLSNEDVDLSQNVLFQASSSVWNALEEEKIMSIYKDGVTKYKELIGSEKLAEMIFNYTSVLKKTLDTYIVTKDERELETLSVLYNFFANGFKD